VRLGCHAHQRRNMLACKALVRDVGDKITVEPMLG
jgi:succinate dehydrogenase/fumarate reductase-like Fe-S protein